MISKKEFLADILYSSNMVNLFKRLPMRNKLIVFNYHRIRSKDSRLSTSFDDGVYTLDSDEFSRQIKWLKHNTNILSEKSLIDCYKDGGFVHPESSTSSVVITFDDGYRDNYTVAYPILKYHDVPAILFVATQMINSRQVAWWDIIAYLIKHCSKPTISFDGRQFLMKTQRKEAIAFFLQRMKQEQYEKTKYLLSELSEACEVGFPDPGLQNKEILTWDEIREMSQHQIAIGSHTHTHRVLSTLDVSAQKEEMLLSKMIIEENIGQPVLTISYPVGEPHYITPETSIIAAACGYLLGFTTNTGVNYWNSIQPHLVKRIARLLEKVSTVSLLTVLPGLFSWDSAAAAQKKSIATHPTYADSYYRLGIIYLGQGTIDQAIDSFQKALHFNPGYTEARIKLGISQVFAGLYDEAIKNFSFILKEKPAFADVHYYQGIVYSSQNKIEKAIQSLEKAVQINSGYKDALIKLGILYCQQQRFSLAMTTLERAMDLDPLDQNLKSLVDAWRKNIAEHCDTPSMLTNLFSSYISSRDQIDELIKGFISHLSISPNINDIMIMIEKGDFSKNNFENLLLLFQDYKTAFPEYSDIHYMVGILYKKLDFIEEAERYLLESLKLNPNYIKPRLELFNLLREQGRFQDALEHGLLLDQFNLLYPDLYCGLGETCLELSRFSEAEQFANKAISLCSDYKMALLLNERIQNSQKSYSDYSQGSDHSDL